MSPTETGKADHRYAEIAKAMAWPAVVLIAILLLRQPLGALLGRAEKVKIDRSGVEIVAAAALGAAAATPRADVASGSQSRTVDPQGIARSVGAALSGTDAARLGDATVLWVDDSPDNNVYERQALEAIGLRFVISTSTDEALSKLRAQAFDVVITDMRRGDDEQAGYRIVDALARAAGKKSPVIIYSGSATPEFEAEAKRRGAYAETNSPQRLFEYVVTAVGTRPVPGNAT